MRMNVKLKGIERESRIKILRFLKSRYGYRPLCKMLNISRSPMYRYLEGKRNIPDPLYF